MVTDAQLVIAFGVGFFLQVFRFLNWQPGYKLMGLALLCAGVYPLLSLYVYLDGGGWLWDLTSFGMIFFTLFGLLLYVFFKEKLIQPVTRQGVVSCFMVLSYWYLTQAQVSEIPFVLIPLFLFLVPLFLLKKCPIWMEVLYHSAMLLSLVVFGWIHMNWEGFSVFTDHPQNGGGYLGLLNALVAGTLYGYLLPHSYFLLALIPIPRKHQSFLEKKRELEELRKILCENFLSEHPSTVLLLLESLLLGFLLVLNYLYHWLEPLLLVNLTLLLLPVLRPLIRFPSFKKD